MKIALGADHAGLTLKNEVKRALTEMQLTVTDFGTESETAVDYPDFARPVADAVASGSHDLGILVCGSGVGMAIAANKIAGVRAANVLNVESARLSREHNDANVLSLGERQITEDLAVAIVREWLGATFEGGRHARRIAMLD